MSHQCWGLLGCHFLAMFPEKLFCSHTFKKQTFLDTLLPSRRTSKTSKDNFPKLLFVSCCCSYPSFYSIAHFRAHVFCVSCNFGEMYVFVCTAPTTAGVLVLGSDTRVIIQLQFDKQYKYSLKKSLLKCVSSDLFNTLWPFYTVPTLALSHCVWSHPSKAGCDEILTTVVLLYSAVEYNVKAPKLFVFWHHGTSKGRRYVELGLKWICLKVRGENWGQVSEGQRFP